MRHLRRHPHGEPVGGGLHHGGARLHRRRKHPRLLEPPADDDCRVSEGGVDVTGVAHLVVDDVAVGALVQERRSVGQRSLDVGQRRQRVVVDVDELSSVHGRRGAAGSHHGHRLADIPHGVGGDEWHVGAVVEAGQQRTPTSKVCPGPGRDHAGSVPRDRNVDREPGVRHRATHKAEMQRPLRPDVGGPQRVAGDEMQVLGPQSRRPDRHAAQTRDGDVSAARPGR